MNSKEIFILSLFLGIFSIANAIDITNTSPFYLHLQTSGGNCPQVIAPGATAKSVSGYCGFDVCSTSLFNSNGCQEYTNGNTGDKTLTDGGYATYLGINATPQTATCSIGWGFIPYKCAIDTSGNFSLTFESITQVYSTGTPLAGQPVAIPSVAHYAQAPFFRGVNISGLEYDGTFLDALFQHPDIPDARYFAGRGMNFIRVPIRAEFLLGTKGNPTESIDPNPKDPEVAVNMMYLAAIYDVTQKYLASGLSVDLDLHNYMRFCPTGQSVGQGNEPTDPVNNNCSVLTATQLADIWSTILTTPIHNIPGISEGSTLSALAVRYAPKDSQYSTPQLIFGVMNEPFDQGAPQPQPLPTATIFNNEVAAAKAIRQIAPTNIILFSGNNWDALHTWMSSTTGNSVTFTQSDFKAQGLDISNLVIEVHQYFDSNYSGLHQLCNKYADYNAFKLDMGLTDPSGKDTFAPWMQQNGMKVMLTEFGGADTMPAPDKSPNVVCQQDMNWMIQYMNEHAYNSAQAANGGFIGWSAWRANRNGDFGQATFNFLQRLDQAVYGAPAAGTTGIVQGLGNGLMKDVFAQYLTPQTP